MLKIISLYNYSYYIPSSNLPLNDNLSADELCSDDKFLLAEAKLPDELYGSAESLLSLAGSYNLSAEISTLETSISPLISFGKSASRS